MLYVVGLFVSCAANSSVEVGSGWPKRSWLLGFLIGFGRASSKERRELRGIAGLGSESGSLRGTRSANASDYHSCHVKLAFGRTLGATSPFLSPCGGRNSLAP